MGKYSGELCRYPRAIWSRWASPAIKHTAIRYFLMGCTEKGTTSYLCVSDYMGKYETNPTKGQKNWPVLFQSVGVMKDKDRLRNHPSLEETKETWLQKATCDPGLGPEIGKGIVKKLVKFKEYIDSNSTSILIYWLWSLYYGYIRHYHRGRLGEAH